MQVAVGLLTAAGAVENLFAVAALFRAFRKADSKACLLGRGRSKCAGVVRSTEVEGAITKTAKTSNLLGFHALESFAKSIPRWWWGGGLWLWRTRLKVELTRSEFLSIAR